VKAFHELTAGGQVRRLRRLGERALERYALRIRDLRPVDHGENTTFRVDAIEPRSRRPRRFLLRVHRAGYQTLPMIRSEVAWLSALAREPSLTAPEPVPARDGSLVQSAQARGVPEARHCTLLRWLSGRFRDRRVAAIHLHRVGVLTARLHAHARRWRPPRGFVRRAWDTTGLLEDGAHWGSAEDAPGLTRAQRVAIRDGRNRVARVLRALERRPDTMGLIHADLHHGNYLFQGDEARPIDFDDCGPGFWLYDFAVTLGALEYRPNYADLRRALLDGYASVAGTLPRHLEVLPALFVARRLNLLAWVASRHDNPVLRPLVAGAVRRVLDTVRRYRRGRLDV
jgi:Ser/Thr protein kinase RdoA (MazF antagonist)